MRKTVLLLVTFAVCLLVAGCSRTVIDEPTTGPNREQVASFTPEDIEACVKVWIEDLSAFGPVATSAQPPLVGYCGILNKGDEIVEMDEFERAFKYWGLRNGKIRYTAATSLPDNFFEQHKFQKSAVASKENAVKIGQLENWRYTVYGTMFAQKPKNAKGERILFYEVYLYMLDIQTGEEVWNSRKMFKLRDSKKTFGL